MVPMFVLLAMLIYVLTDSGCQAAALALGVTDSTWQDESHNVDVRPKGCFDWGGSAAYLNPNPGVSSNPGWDNLPMKLNGTIVSQTFVASNANGHDESHNVDVRPKGCFDFGGSAAYLNPIPGVPSNPGCDDPPMKQITLYLLWFRSPRCQKALYLLWFPSLGCKITLY